MRIRTGNQQVEDNLGFEIVPEGGLTASLEETTSRLTRVHLAAGASVLDYVEFTASLPADSNDEMDPRVLVQAAPRAYDGLTRVRVTFYAPNVSADANVSNPNPACVVELYDNGVPLGIIGSGGNFGFIDGTVTLGSTVGIAFGSRIFTPTAGSHVFMAGCWAGTPGDQVGVDAGSGGVGAFVPGYLLVERL